MTELKDSVSFLSSKFDEAQKTNLDLLQEMRALRNDIAERRQLEEELRDQVAVLRERIMDMEQYQRRANIEVANLPEVAGEDPYELVVASAKAAGVNINKEDIDVCHRVPTKGKGPRPLIARLQRTKTRDDILDKGRKRKGIPVAEIIPDYQAADPNKAKVYLQEHLTQELKQLFYLARLKKTELDWKYAWARGGRIFMRKDDGSRITRIASEADLELVK